MLQTLYEELLKAGPYLLAHKDLALSMVGGAAGLSVFAQGILHKFNIKLSAISPTKKKVWSFVLAQTLTGIAAIAAYLVANVDLKEFYPWLATLVTAVHQLAVNPIYVNKVLPFLNFQAEQKASATETGVYGGEPVNTPQAAGIFVS